MGVSRKEYLIVGCKFEDERFIKDYWNMDELRDELEFVDDPWILSDGMSGNYMFFGKIEHLTEYGENDEITQIMKIMDHQHEEIKLKFQDTFPDVEMPEICTYHVPHYG